MNNNLFALADNLKVKKDEEKQLKELLDVVKKEIDQLDNQLVQGMIDEEIQSFNLSGKLFYLRTSVKASAASGEQENLIQWLKDNDAADLVKETVNAQSLSSYVKELLDESDGLPEDLEPLVNVFEKTTVAIRKA